MLVVYVVVPGYYLVWYNIHIANNMYLLVVVPGYYLVWYNGTDTAKTYRLS